MSFREMLLALAVPVLLWFGLSRICDLLWHRPWIAGAVLGALILIASVLALVNTVRERRAAYKAGEELRQMRLCYPACHVKRLRGGDWFLADRATGREYEIPREETADA
jgi:hypothetical protein